MFNTNAFFMNLVVATKRAKDNDLSSSDATKAALFSSLGSGTNMALGLVNTIETMKGKENEKELEDQVQNIGTENKALKIILDEVKAADITALQLEVANLKTSLDAAKATAQRLQDTNVNLTSAYNKELDNGKALQVKIDELTSQNADLLGAKVSLESEAVKLNAKINDLESKLDDCNKALDDCKGGNKAGKKS
jgi:chromosome segregation ATPase